MGTVPCRIDSSAAQLMPLDVVQFGQQIGAAPASPEPDVYELAQDFASDCRLVTAGTELLAEGETTDKLYVVLSGWVLLHRILEDGRRQILDFALPGSVLGYRARPDAAQPFSAEALTDTEIAVIPLSRVREALTNGSTCALSLLNAANDALLGAFDTLTDIGRRTAREAIANFLLRMDRRIRNAIEVSDSVSVPLPLTQEHIGDTLGLTAVHVCRTLRRLREDGLVEAGRGRLKILDKNALAIEAGVYFANREPDDFKEPKQSSTRVAGTAPSFDQLSSAELVSY